MRTVPTPPNRFVMTWLVSTIVLIMLIVVVGGLTRLTESGLSIVEWKLVTGILPPMSEEAWQQEFEAYKQFPEYQKVRSQRMSVDEFKNIYWLEYWHRILARIIGLWIALPYFIFRFTKQLTPLLKTRGAMACGLVLLQGVVGWYMVKSGLQHDPRVHPLMLSLHLSMALTLLGLLQITALQYEDTPQVQFRSAWLWRLARILLALIAIQIIFGALVAGWDAGLTYNTFPLMDGQWIPSGMLMFEPAIINVVKNITLVQFQHRWLAVGIGLVLLIFTIFHARTLRENEMLKPLLAVWAAYIAQFLLGVFTLLHVVPLHLASLHQLGAVMLLVCVIWLNAGIRRFSVPEMPNQRPRRRMMRDSA